MRTDLGTSTSYIIGQEFENATGIVCGSIFVLHSHPLFSSDVPSSWGQSQDIGKEA